MTIGAAEKSGHVPDFFYGRFTLLSFGYIGPTKLDLRGLWHLLIQFHSQCTDFLTIPLTTFRKYMTFPVGLLFTELLPTRSLVVFGHVYL